MRIIAGEFRHRRLLGPADNETTRPTPDRVKEALFDRLTALGFFSDEGAGSVADVFCGTGSLGLEALSRGARRCIFVEQDREALRRLKQNIDTLDVQDRAIVQVGSAMSAVWLSVAAGDPVAMLFLDPPYRMAEQQPDRVADLLARCASVVHPEGIAVLRLPKQVDPPKPIQWPTLRSHVYGSMTLHLYEKRDITDS